MTDIILPVAAAEDAPLLAELAARLFEQTFGPANTAEDMAEYLAENFGPAQQLAELGDANRRVWIAVHDGGQAIGYASLLRGSTTAGVTGGRPAEVERIYVDRTSHGRGTGELLMTQCVAQAVDWKCDVLWLAVWERNPRAIAFYEKSGFEKVGMKTFELGSDLQRDFVMARFLSV